jgi:hypothetical protein
MECQACKTRGKTWNGADPKCGFREGPFTGDNWNCALANEIRDLAEREGDYRINHQCEENQHFATISLLDIDTLPRENDKGFMNSQPTCLWVGWYKSRGRTEGMWLMFENVPPRPPTEEECRTILNAYEKKEG